MAALLGLFDRVGVKCVENDCLEDPAISFACGLSVGGFSKFGKVGCGWKRLRNEVTLGADELCMTGGLRGPRGFSIFSVMRRVIFFGFVVLSLVCFRPLLWVVGELLSPAHPATPADQPLTTDIANFFLAIEAVVVALPFIVVGYCLLLDVVCWVVMVVAKRVGAKEWEKGFRYSLIYSMVLSFFAVIMAGWAVVLRML